MKKQTDEKKKKKLTKKLKKIRGVVMMMMVCVLLLSAATYAWFSLSNLARVSNLTMAVSEADGLQVALNKGNEAGTTVPSESDWTGSIDLSVDVVKGVLKPATTADGKKFKVPKYNEEGQVTGQDDTVSAVELNKTKTTANEITATSEGHFYRYTFWMRSLKDETAIIRLARGNNIDSDSRTGTYMVPIRDEKEATLLSGRGRNNVDHSKNKINAASAMRVSIIAGDYLNSDNYAVYEPMSDVHPDANSASDRVQAAKITDYEPIKGGYNAKLRSQKADGSFGDAGYSDTVITLKKDEKTLITLLIWIEGDDEDCFNQIEMDDLKMQLQFEKVKTN